MAKFRYVAMDSKEEPLQRIEELKSVLRFAANKNSELMSEVDDKLSLLRLEIEKNMLALMIAYMAAIVEGVTSDDSKLFISSATEGFLDCSKQIENLEGDIEDILLSNQIEAEVFIGLSGCTLFSFFFVTDIPKKLKDDMETTLLKVRSLLSGEEQIIPALYELAPEFLELMLEPSHKKRVEISEILTHHLKSAEDEEMPSTQLDQFVMRDLVDRVQPALEAWIEAH